MKKAALIAVTGAFMFLSCKPAIEELVDEKVQSLSEMAELGTVEYTIKKVIRAEDTVLYKYGERKILFTCTAFLKAGIDMAGFSEENIEIDMATNDITVTLPKTSILSYHLPADMIHQEFCNVPFYRSNFTLEEKQDLKKQAEKDILEDVPSYGILEEAEKNALLFFEAMFKQIGFNTVTVKFE